MQHIIICDDNREVMSYLARMIERVWKRPCAITELAGPEELERYMIESPGNTIDILFMDIKLGDVNGIALSRDVARRYPHMRIIYITGYVEYCEDIFKGAPTALLVKPIKQEKLLFALEKATEELRQAESKVVQIKARTGENVWLVHSDIYYVESRGRLVRLACRGGIVESYQKLSNLEATLSDVFLRCHQSYLVNLDMIHRIERERLYLMDGTEIPISKSKAKQVRERLLEYAGALN